MVYIKYVDKNTGKVKKMHYPRLASAKHAARKWQRDWNPLKSWEVEGIYYKDGRTADPTFKKGFHEGLADVLRGIV